MFRRFHPHTVIRSFPELSDLTSEECIRLWKHLRRHLPRSHSWAWVGSVVLGSCLGSIGFVTRSASDAVRARLDNILAMGSWAVMLAFIPISIVWIMLVAVVPVAIHTTGIRRTVTRHLRKRRCLWCDYSLIGLTPTDGKVRCPECGAQNDARLLGTRLKSEPVDCNDTVSPGS